MSRPIKSHSVRWMFMIFACAFAFAAGPSPAIEIPSNLILTAPDGTEVFSVDDCGNIFLTGEFEDNYVANHGCNIPDPPSNIRAWTMRNSDSDIVMRVDIWDEDTTSCLGNLYFAGEFAGGLEDGDPDSVITSGSSSGSGVTNLFSLTGSTGSASLALAAGSSAAGTSAATSAAANPGAQGADGCADYTAQGYGKIELILQDELTGDDVYSTPDHIYNATTYGVKAVAYGNPWYDNAWGPDAEGIYYYADTGNATFAGLGDLGAEEGSGVATIGDTKESSITVTVWIDVEDEYPSGNVVDTLTVSKTITIEPPDFVAAQTIEYGRVSGSTFIREKTLAITKRQLVKGAWLKVPLGGGVRHQLVDAIGSNNAAVLRETTTVHAIAPEGLPGKSSGINNVPAEIRGVTLDENVVELPAAGHADVYNFPDFDIVSEYTEKYEARKATSSKADDAPFADDIVASALTAAVPLVTDIGWEHEDYELDSSGNPKGVEIKCNFSTGACVWHDGSNETSDYNKNYFIVTPVGSSSPAKNIYVTPSGDEVSAEWDGYFEDGSILAHGDPYELKFHGVAEDTYYNPTTGAIVTDYARKTFTESDVVIKINGGFPRELETDNDHTFTAVDLHGVGPTNFEWDFGGKAYEHGASDTATPYQYQTSQQLNTAALSGNAIAHAKYCSGGKSSLSGTDLGYYTVNVSFDKADGSTGSASCTFDLISGSAAITFYRAVREIDYKTKGTLVSKNVWATATSLSSPVSYLFASGFPGAVGMEGHGLIYRIRDDPSETAFESGEAPGAGQKYLCYGNVGDVDGDGKDNTRWYFRDSPPNGTGGTLALQDVAIYFKNDTSPLFRSCYNLGSTYHIHHLKERANANIQRCINDNVKGIPKMFISDYWNTNDTGEFGKFTRQEDEKHIDVYLEPAVEGEGVSKRSCDEMSSSDVASLKVTKK